MSHLLPSEKLEEQLPKLLPGVLALYKKHAETSHVSKVRAQQGLVKNIPSTGAAVPEPLRVSGSSIAPHHPHRDLHYHLSQVPFPDPSPPL